MKEYFKIKVNSDEENKRAATAFRKKGWKRWSGGFDFDELIPNYPFWWVVDGGEVSWNVINEVDIRIEITLNELESSFQLFWIAKLERVKDLIWRVTTKLNKVKCGQKS